MILNTYFNNIGGRTTNVNNEATTLSSLNNEDDILTDDDTPMIFKIGKFIKTTDRPTLLIKAIA